MSYRLFAIVLIAAPFALATIVAPAAAEACSLMPHQYLEGADEELDGEEPPQPPVVEVANIKRGTGPQSEGCGQTSVTSCDDIGWVTLQIENAGPDVGYEIAISDGEPPPGAAEGSSRPIQPRNGEIMLSWSDGATDEQEAIDVTFEITAVDRWGQRSESSDSVHVSHPGSEGPVCSIVGRGGVDASWWLLLLAGGLLVGTRRGGTREYPS